MKEKISVIMAVYNDEKNIANAVESILSQTYENFELIISLLLSILTFMSLTFG